MLGASPNCQHHRGTAKQFFIDRGIPLRYKDRITSSSKDRDYAALSEFPVRLAGIGVGADGRESVVG
jgi:hypothetical protein